MTDKKIFFADLDGTLLNSEKRLTPDTRKAICEFMDAGNYFVISTGRSIVSALGICKEYGFDWENTYIACFNGNIIYHPSSEKILHRIVMDRDDVLDIFKMFKEADVYCQTYSDTHIVTDHDSIGLRHYLSIEDDAYTITDDVLGELSHPPCKILGIETIDHSKLEVIRKRIEERYGGRYYCMYSDPHYLEVMPVGSGKGAAVGALCRILDVPVENTLAAGDHENDVSMIEAAGLGVAMINGVEKARAAADVITELDNDHDGLCSIIRDFI